MFFNLCRTMFSCPLLPTEQYILSVAQNEKKILTIWNEPSIKGSVNQFLNLRDLQILSSTTTHVKKKKKSSKKHFVAPEEAACNLINCLTWRHWCHKWQSCIVGNKGSRMCGMKRWHPWFCWIDCDHLFLNIWSIWVQTGGQFGAYITHNAT